MKHIKLLVLSLFVGGVSLALSPVAFAQTYQYQPYGQYQPYAYNGYSYQNTNRLPFFISAPVTTATVNDNYVYGARAQDPDGNTVTYSLTQAPAGMTINPVTHVIVWTPTSVGTFPVTVAAADYTGQWATQSFVITVSPSKNAVTTQTTRPQTVGEARSEGAAGYSLFSSKPKTLEISNIQVISGPRNISTGVSGANCSVAVNWTTNIASVGQVVYGTRSQPSADAFQYSEAAGEGSAPSTVHSVTLPSCLSEQTYYFRVVAYAGTQHAVSGQMTILPLPVEVPTGYESVNNVSPEVGSASVVSTIGRIILNPIVLILIIASVLFIVVRKLGLGSKPSAPSHGHGHGPEEALAEPSIAIPHH